MSDDEEYLIKRYSNRKLYDSVRRKFTTLDEVAALLDDGKKVVVRDHDSGVDRTDEVLAQVLRRKAQSTPGSSNFLADLLRAPADVAKTVVEGTGLDSRISDIGSEKKEEAVTGKRTSSADIAALVNAARALAGGDTDKSNGLNEANAQIERQEAEIQELRDQVAQLTEAVTLLLKQQTGE
ncbi:hypothetical protein HH308_22825 [Gordonia sp. TBRC 11910]|uniref:PHA accumulation regulator DNA-binding N-terminal domain-containing protein n=1 Tax=Gordonia asplenii TaxID=2725283 RepID=A0A848L5W6_9ACTN|nr:polyhydroxyalkanoate synthesis regulator DNA-binding domain-containing protein [Gordonia asplenii]NMO04053.1 hypothetical protein [Gordonia asplenii]